MSTCAKRDYELIDEKTQNGYGIDVVKAVLIDVIQDTHNVKTLSIIAKQVFGIDNQIVRWWDDDGLGIAYDKHSDEMQYHLAKMAIKKIRSV